MFYGENDGLTFTDNNLKGVTMPHNNLIVIMDEVGECFLVRLVVDKGATANILYVN